MILYLDTSAFLKLYIDGPGAEVVRSLLKRASTVQTHLLTYAETRADLAMAARMGRVEAKAMDAHKQELERDWLQMDILLPDEAMIRRAGDLAENFGLRGYDSIHLAAADLVARQSNEFIFACFDDGLNRAAGALGMQIIESS